MCGQRVENVETGVQKTTQEGDREIDREYMMSVIASSDRPGTIVTIMGRWRLHFRLNGSHRREREHEVARLLSDSNWVERTWDVQSRNNQRAECRSAASLALRILGFSIRFGPAPNLTDPPLHWHLLLHDFNDPGVG